SVLNEVVIVSKALSQVPVPFKYTIGFAASVVSSPNGSLGSAVALCAGAAGGLAAAAGGAGVCAQDGCGSAAATIAAATPIESAKRRNIRLSHMQTGAPGRRRRLLISSSPIGF